MKNLAYTFLIAGAIVLAFALLARFVPGITITDFMFGFCDGIGTTLAVAGLILLIPAALRNKKGDATRDAKNPDAKNHDQKK